MVSILFITFTSLIVCIQCENFMLNDNDDGIDAENSVKHVNEIWNTKKVHHRHRHGLQTNRIDSSTTSDWLQFLSDDSNAGTQSYVSKSADSNQYVRRTKFRQRKINGGNGNHRKTTTFRRGQRHRNNKNGN